jgi:hypothetical protein
MALIATNAVALKTSVCTETMNNNLNINTGI